METNESKNQTVDIDQYQISIKCAMDMVADERKMGNEKAAEAHNQGMWKMWRWYTVINISVTVIFWLIEHL